MRGADAVAASWTVFRLLAQEQLREVVGAGPCESLDVTHLMADRKNVARVYVLPVG
jgi:hypothetical protein